jgi:hypothetical protein
LNLVFVLHHRKEATLTFDPNRFDLAGAVRRVMEAKIGSALPARFDELHKCTDVNNLIVNKRQVPLSEMQVSWNLDRGRLDGSTTAAQYQEFDSIYHQFIAEVVAPSMGTGRILYQRAPTLRIYFPSEVALGQLHHDRDYHHQPSEINFWLPLTDVFGNNSLWIESEPEKGDTRRMCFKASYSHFHIWET